MMRRFLSILFMLGTIGLPLSSASGASKAPVLEIPAFAENVMLRESARIDGKIIYLGDVFTNTGDKENSALAYAPAPGKRAVFDARWLYRVAKSYKLDWRPLSQRDHIIVRRASTVISKEEIAEQMREVLADKGADPDMEIYFSNRLLRLHVAGDGISEIGIEDLAYDTRSRRFSAIIHAPAGDPAASRTRVSGRLYETIEIPVASRRLLKDDIIRKSDLRWIRVRTSRLQNDAVTNPEDIIGKTPKRGIRSGQPIRASVIQRPVLVKKGSLVTIHLQSRRLMLTAQGKALQSGSDGDVIRIANTQSNQTIEAEIVGSGRVAVRSTRMLALN